MPRNPNHRRLRWWVALIAVTLLAWSAPAAAAPAEPKPPGKPILLDAGPQTDQAIERRIAAIYAELESLTGVEVEVEAGVVHLRGTVRSLEATKDARAIAERVEGVAAVVDETQLDASVRERLRPIVEQTIERTSNWLTYLPLLLAAAAVIALSWLFGRWVARRRRRDSDSNPFARQFFDQFLRFGILAIGIGTALDMLGARGLLGGLIGTAGVIGIVIGFAFKSTGEAYVASVMLSLRRPFDPNDLVRIGEQEGRVVRLTSRATLLMTIDGNHTLIPNSRVYDAEIINFSRNPQRRFCFCVGVGHEAALEPVQELALATLASTPGVLAEPAAFCYVEEFGETAMILSVGAWIDQRQSDWLKTASEAKRRIKSAFDRAGIARPEPSLRIRTIVPGEAEPGQGSERTAEPSRDVSPDHHLERQVDEERASQAEHDLLREAGPTE